MKKIHPSLAVILLLIISSNTLQAQWTRTNGPTYSTAYSLQTDSQYLYAATNRNIYRTSDGVHWDSIGPAAFGYNPHSFLVTEGELYADLYANSGLFPDPGLYRSFDHGETWALASGKQITVITKFDSQLFALASPNDSIYKSYDDGHSWYAFKPPYAISYIRQILAFDGRVYLIADNALFSSDTSLKSWKGLGNGAYLNISADNLYMSWSSGIIYRKHKGQPGWDTLKLPFNSAIPEPAVLNDSLYIVGFDDSLHKTSLKTILWEGMITHLSPTEQYFNLCTFKNQLFSGTYGAGINKWSNEEKKFIRSDSGIYNSSVTKMIWFHNKIFANSELGGGLWESNDGMNWISQYDTFQVSGSDIYSDDTCVFATLRNEVISSCNNGNSWQGLYSIIPFSGISSLLKDKNYLFLGLENGVQRFDLYTGDYETADLPYDGYDYDNIITSLVKTQTTHILFAGGGGGVFKSTDEGSTWTVVPETRFDNTTGMVAKGDTIFEAASGLNYSIDGGLNWTPIIAPLFVTPYRLGVGKKYLYIAEDISNNLYALPLSSLEEGNWISVGDGLPNFGWIYSILETDSFLYAGMWSYGVWRRPLTDWIITNSDPAKVSNSLLIFPNPSNDLITVSANDLPHSAFSITIFNEEGQAQFVRFFQQDQSLHSIPVDIAALSKGAYLVKLQSPKEILQAFFIKQ